MSRLLYVSLNFSTLHQKKPVDLPSGGSGGPKLTIGGYDVTDKFYLELGYGDPGEISGYDTFDYSEFAIAGASFLKPHDWGAKVDYQVEARDGLQQDGTKSKYHTVWVPDDFVIPAEVGPIIDPAMKIALAAAEQGGVAWMEYKGAAFLSNFLTAYNLRETVAKHLARQFDLMDLGMSGTISLADYERATTRSMVDFRKDLEKLLDGVAANYVQALTAQGVALEDSGKAGLRVVPFDADKANGSYGTFGDDMFIAGSERHEYVGLGGDDILIGGAGSDTLRGGGDNDVLSGGAGNDLLESGHGNDVLRGGKGHDVYVVGSWGEPKSGRTVIDERGGGGSDTVIAYQTFSLGNPNIHGRVENLWLKAVNPRTGKDIAANGTGNGLNNSISGNDATNLLKGLGGNDQLDGGYGDDLLMGGAGKDILIGGKGRDTASYQDAKGVTVHLKNPLRNEGIAKGDTYKQVENVTGSKFADTLTGNDSANVLRGLDGADRLSGGKRSDILDGGLGRDILAGGKHADTFLFRSIKDSPVTAKGWDVIKDFRQRDKDRIDVSGIDAKAGTRKNDAFSFIGDRDFTGKAGELRFDTGKKKTFVYGDVNGDGRADFKIELLGKVALLKQDFVL
jgi:Ca2+-binding RTX toxin-like protein